MTMLPLPCPVATLGVRRRRRRGLVSVVILLLAALLVNACATPAATHTTLPSRENPIKVGLLHSLSGPLAISEVPVRDAALMAIDEINARGGLLGRRVVPIVEDGESNPDAFAAAARKLLREDGVAAIFGCWTSSSRKAVLPIVQAEEALLWYPVQYEGLEQSPNIIYLGATTNQQIIPAVEYLLSQGKRRFFLLGSDYIFPRTANQIVRLKVAAGGGEVQAEMYAPLNQHNFAGIIDIIEAAQPDVILNTLNGESNVAFFQQLAARGLTAENMLTLSVSIAEEEIRSIGAEYMVGHLAAWNYFQTIDTPENQAFVAAYKARYGDDRVTSDPIEAAYVAVHLWAQAVERSGSIDPARVREAAKGLSFTAPSGQVMIDADNQHLYKTVRIGRVRADGQFDEIWNSGQPMKPDPFLYTYAWAAGLRR